MNNTVLYIFAFVFFLLAAFYNPGLPADRPWYGRVHVGWLGLAFWVATLINFR